MLTLGVTLNVAYSNVEVPRLFAVSHTILEYLRGIVRFVASQAKFRPLRMVFLFRYNVLFRAASHQVILFSIYAAMRCTSIVTLINKCTALTTVIQIYSGFV